MDFNSGNSGYPAGVALHRLEQAKRQYVAVTTELATREALELQIGVRTRMLVDLGRLRLLLAGRLMVRSNWPMDMRGLSRRRARRNYTGACRKQNATGAVPGLSPNDRNSH